MTQLTFTCQMKNVTNYNWFGVVMIFGSEIFSWIFSQNNFSLFFILCIWLVKVSTVVWQMDPPTFQNIFLLFLALYLFLCISPHFWIYFFCLLFCICFVYFPIFLNLYFLCFLLCICICVFLTPHSRRLITAADK